MTLSWVIVGVLGTIIVLLLAVLFSVASAFGDVVGSLAQIRSKKPFYKRVLEKFKKGR